VQGFDE